MSQLIAPPLAGPVYIGVTLTLTTGQHPYNLLALIQAVSGYANVNGLANDVLVLADKGNTDVVLVGDAAISTTNYGYSMGALASRRYGPFTQSCFPLASLWVETLGTTASQIIHVEIAMC